jgi:hypothetical protein
VNLARKLVILLSASVLACLGGGNAVADDFRPAESLRRSLWGPPARLVGGWSPAGRTGEGPRGGALLGVEGAWATTLPASDDPAHGSLALGVRAGWAFASGLALHVRYDDLGVAPSSSRSPLQAATAGRRYSLPFVAPLPFAEVDAGPAFVGGDVQFGAAAGLGASLPLGPYVLVDLVARDWLVSVAGELRQTVTAGLGLTVTFASPGR